MVSPIFYVGGDFVTEKEFVEKIGKLAAEDMKTSGILASVTTAQACLESGYGTTEVSLVTHGLLLGMERVNIRRKQMSKPKMGKFML